MRSSAPPMIMVVEDEEVIGMFLSEQLRAAGFSVRVLPDAASAWLFLADEAIGAAIIDVGLPDRKGNDLARQCHSTGPTLPIILRTRYDERPFQQAFGGRPYVRVMGKPFDRLKLLSPLHLHFIPRTTTSPLFRVYLACNGVHCTNLCSCFHEHSHSAGAGHLNGARESATDGPQQL